MLSIIYVTTNYLFSLQARNGHPFWDPQAILTNFSSALPDPLRIKPNGVQANQLGVYEDFSADGSKRRMIASMTSRPSSAISYTGNQPNYTTSPGPDVGVVQYSQQETMSRLTVCIYTSSSKGRLTYPKTGLDK